MKFIGDNRLQVIERLVTECEEMWLAVSYVRNSGIGLIRPLYLDSLISLPKCRVLVDTDMRISEKDALLSILNDGLQLKHYIGNGSFHPKVWLFKISNSWKAVVGSMNVSLGALHSNVEACILLDDSETMDVVNWFQTVWSDSHNVAFLDSAKIQNLPEPYQFRFYRNKPEGDLVLQSAISMSAYNSSDILSFISEWASDQYREYPSNRKTGWFFRPAHGDFDSAKLTELQNVLNAMFPGNENIYHHNEQNATRVLVAAGVSYSRPNHQTNNKERLMKQQINYLSKLELIEKESGNTWNTTLITPVGFAYKTARPANLDSFLTKVLIYYRWFGVNIYDFTKTVLGMVDQNKLYYNEYFIFLRHAGVQDYTYHTPEQIASLITIYRSLNENEKHEVWRHMEQKAAEADTSRSESSFSNIKNNRAPDMFRDLALTPGISRINMDYLYLA